MSGISASPNPFDPNTQTTTISYTLANSALLWIRIYDGSNNLKRNLVTPASFTATNKAAGANSDIWNGRDNSSVIVSDGLYPYRIDNLYYITYYTGLGSPMDIVVNPANTSIIWGIDDAFSNSFKKSTDGGTNWSSVNSGSDRNASGLAISDDGLKIYIANPGKSALRKSTDGGTNWANSATFPGSVTSVSDVAVDSSGNTVYALDSTSGPVYKSTNGGTNWATCTGTGLTLGTTYGIATDSTGTTVIIADSSNNRLYKSTDGCSTFSQIAAITSGTAAGQVTYPYQVSIQADGSFWVSERTNNRIQLFDSNGNSMMVIGGTAGGTGNYQFNAGGIALGIALATISGQPHIFVADYNNGRTRKYAYDNWTSSTNIQVQTADVTPPANPTGFTVTNPQTGNTLNFSWTNPTDPDFAGVKLVRATGGTPPTDCNSGTVSYQGIGTSFSEVDLTDGTQYSYRLCAYDNATPTANMSGGVTGSGTPTDTAAPSDVTGLTATPGNTQVLLSWTNPGDLDYSGTKVLRKTGAFPSSCADGTATQVYSGTGTSHTDTGLTNGTTYYYRVCAFDEVPNYPTGATVSATPYLDTTPPGEVSGFTIDDPFTGGKLNLSWSTPSDPDFAGVKIVRASGGTAPADCATGTVVYNSNGFGYSDTGLTNGTQYSYRACAYDLSGNYSAGVTGSGTPSDLTPPANVGSFTAIAGDAQVALSWTNPSDSDFAGTRILRRNDQAPASCTDASATVVYSGIGTAHTDMGLTNDIVYYYLACSFDAAPNYPGGAAANATPGNDVTPPAAVSNLSGTSTVYTRGANLTWTAPGDDGAVGTASNYDFRYIDAFDYPGNMASYTNTNWASLTQASGESAPQSAGATEILTVSKDTGGTYLKPNTLYYFAMKATDDFGNVSGISNLAAVHSALKQGYNTVSIPYKSSTGGTNTLNDLLIDDLSYVYVLTWQPYGLDSGTAFNGEWVSLDSSSALNTLSDGKGYYMYAYNMNSSVMDEKNSLDSALMSDNTDSWTRIDLSQGRNLAGNPYLKNVDFTNVKICQNASGFSAATGCSGGTVVSFAQAVTNGWLDGSIAHYANSTTYTYETCNGISCTAKLRPWWGQWVYLLGGSPDAYIMAVPKP